MSLKPMSLIDDQGLGELKDWANKALRGNFIEVGVFKGGSAWVLDQICEKKRCNLHLFDTFEGIPYAEEIDLVKPGNFKGSYFDVCKLFPKAFIYKGIWPYTMPDYLNNITFAHIDCDIAETHRDVARLLPERMKTGGIIYFDDYGNMPGNKKAVDDAFGNEIIVMNQRAVWVKR